MAGYELVNAVHPRDGIAQMEKETDILAVAGGDGTVRGACMELLQAPLKDNRPIGLLALGTANNIARTLHIEKDISTVIRSWDRHKIKHFDVGRIDGDEDKSTFFVESCGFGIFPKLLRKIKNIPKAEKNTPEKEFKAALALLLELCKKYKTQQCRIIIDGKDYSGKYILAEILNIRSLGPKLQLAPKADPGDGYLDVLLVSARKRPKMIGYIEKISQGAEPVLPFKTIRARDIHIYWGGNKDFHIDDRPMAEYKPKELKITILYGVLNFLVQ